MGIQAEIINNSEIMFGLLAMLFLNFLLIYVIIEPFIQSVKSEMRMNPKKWLIILNLIALLTNIIFLIIHFT